LPLRKIRACQLDEALDGDDFPVGQLVVRLLLKLP
jgi:hypothetical protein